MLNLRFFLRFLKIVPLVITVVSCGQWVVSK